MNINQPTNNRQSNNRQSKKATNLSHKSNILNNQQTFIMVCMYCRYGGITWCGNCKNTTKTNTAVQSPSADKYHTINPKNLKPKPVVTKRATTSVQTTTEPKSQEISSYWNTPTHRPEDNCSDDNGTKFSGTFGSTSTALSW